MIHLFREEKTLTHKWPYLLLENPGDQILVFGRGDLVLVFNFNPVKSFSDYGFPVDPGKFQIRLNTDSVDYGGQGLVNTDMTYYAYPDQHTSPRHMLKLYIPARSALVLKKIPHKRVHQ
jgi:1,4-alpha-glucan branching enzyme